MNIIVWFLKLVNTAEADHFCFKGLIRSGDDFLSVDIEQAFPGLLRDSENRKRNKPKLSDGRARWCGH